MTGTSAPSDRRSSDHGPEVPADVLMSVLGERVSVLHALAQELEISLSETLGAADRLSADAFRTIQRVDYLRQALKDIGAILTHVGDGLCWSPGQEIRIDALHELVDMHQSLEGLRPSQANSTQGHDIWL